MTTENWKTILYTDARDIFFKDNFTEERVTELVKEIVEDGRLAGTGITRQRNNVHTISHRC